MKGKYMDLKEMVSTIENYTDDVQLFLWETLKEILFKKKGPIKIKPCAELESIIATGIVVPDGELFAVSGAAKKQVRKLYAYLGRKYDTESYFDPETCEMIDIPKGAEFVCGISLDGKSSGLTLRFPDDEITALLDLFGVNPCDKWPRK